MNADDRTDLSSNARVNAKEHEKIVSVERRLDLGKKKVSLQMSHDAKNAMTRW